MEDILGIVRDIARQFKDDCDGSYVGQSGTGIDIDVNGAACKIDIEVFWDRSFWASYKIYGNNVNRKGEILF